MQVAIDEKEHNTLQGTQERGKRWVKENITLKSVNSDPVSKECLLKPRTIDS